MPNSRRVRTLATPGVLAVALGLFTGPADPAAASTFTIVGGGYGHGIGMSQSDQPASRSSEPGGST
jgi:hypothetical protein